MRPTAAPGDALLEPGPGVRAVFLAALVLAVVAGGFRGIYRPAEARYTAVAVQMLDSGDWLTPRLNHETLHFTKPPLTYWATAASMTVFGRNEFAVRLPNALALLGTCALLGWVSRRLQPRRPWLAPTLYGLCAFPFVSANVVTTDVLLTLFTTLTGCAFVAWRLDERRRGSLLWLMWLGLALAFMTKGPPALLPLLAIVVFTCWQDGWRALGRLLSLWGLATFVAVGLPWYVAVIAKHAGLANWFLEREVVARLFTGEHRRNPSPLYVLEAYVPLLAGGTFPWVLTTPASVWRALHEPAGQGAVVARFLLCWFALPTLVFFVVPSRLPLYLLQVFPPLLLLTAHYAPDSLLRGPRAARWMGALLGVAAVALIGIRWLPESDDTRQFAGELSARLPFTPREVVFLGNPHLALGLYYRGCEVEVIGLGSGFTDTRQPMKGVEEELAENEPLQLFAVDLRFREGFLERAARVPQPLQPLGEVRGFALYARVSEVRSSAAKTPDEPATR